MVIAVLVVIKPIYSSIHSNNNCRRFTFMGILLNIYLPLIHFSSGLALIVALYEKGGRAVIVVINATFTLYLILLFIQAISNRRSGTVIKFIVFGFHFLLI